MILGDNKFLSLIILLFLFYYSFKLLTVFIFKQIFLIVQNCNNTIIRYLLFIYCTITNQYLKHKFTRVYRISRSGTTQTRGEEQIY